jgi:hypothetical protein
MGDLGMTWIKNGQEVFQLVTGLQFASNHRHDRRKWAQ